MSEEIDDGGYRPSVVTIWRVFAGAPLLMLSGVAIYLLNSDGATAQPSARPSAAASQNDGPVTVTEADDPCTARTRRNNIIRPCEDEHAEPVLWVSDRRMGIGGVSLGMSLDEVIASVDRYALYPYTVEDCISARGIRECNVQSNILPDGTRSTFQVIEGLDFRLLASINRMDRVFVVSLTHDDDQASAELCRSKFERVLDWASTRYGPFAGRIGGENYSTHASTGGTNYLVWSRGADSSFPSMRTIPHEGATYDPAQPITRWDENQYVSVSGSFISSSCSINLSYSEPRSRQFRDER